MGLTNTQSNSAKIVTIVEGKFSIRLADDSDNTKAVERTLKKGKNAGKVVKELHYTGIEGKIQSCYVDESDFGANFITVMEDDEGSKFKLQMPLDSQFFSQYAKRMPNIDRTQPLFLGLGFDREKGRHFLFARQNGEKVLMKFTRDNPNGIPEPTVKTVQGKEKWDYSEQANFLYEVAMDFSNFEVGHNQEDKDDIPF